MYENARKKYSYNEKQLLQNAAIMYVENSDKYQIETMVQGLACICKRNPKRIRIKLQSYIRAYQ